MRTVSFRSLRPLGGALTLQVQDAQSEAIAVRTALEYLAAQRAPLSYLDLSGLDLQDACLDGLDAEFCNFQKSNLSGATLRGATLQNCDLQYITTSPRTKLTGSSLIVCNLTGALLAGVAAEKTDWGGSNLTAVHAAGLIAPESNFRNCRTTRGDFRDAVLSWSNVSNLWEKAQIVAASAGSEIEKEVLRIFNDRGCNPLARAELESAMAESVTTAPQ